MTTPLPRPPADRLERELPDKKPLFSDAEAEAEANRCLYCADAPCIKACPTEIDIPTFIKKIASGNVRGSARTIFEQNMLGYSCARVCPVEVLCAGSCVYNAWGREPIAIGRLQRYATEKATQAGQQPLFRAKSASGKKVAMIGAGPASLACAAYLALEGHKSVIFEKRPLPGGLNTTGIAPYKLQADDAIHEIKWLLDLGHIEIEPGVEIGKQVSGADLLKDYDAVFIGVGLGEDTKLGLPGEDGPGVFGATAWIEKLKTAPAQDSVPPLRGKRVLVVGGGNTAIDVARECAQLGASDVAMVYRRGSADMSGYHHEMEHARLEGVRLVENSVPVAFVRDDQGNLTGLRVAKTDDGKAVAGTEHDLPCDFVALAIGQSKLRSVAKELPGVALDARGCVVADEKTCQTGNEKVFAGGDCVNGGKEVVNAVADGRNAARTLIARWGRASSTGSKG
jgi:glutamate synthase (NADPH/NADH) small chain